MAGGSTTRMAARQSCDKRKRCISPDSAFERVMTLATWGTSGTMGLKEMLVVMRGRVTA